MKKTMSIALCVAVIMFSIVACKKKKKDDTTTTNTTTTTNPNQFTDSRDNKTYATVTIGTQTWMAQNLNYDASGSKCYSNSVDSCAKYGKLYDEVTAQSVCPTGYHLPTDNEWKTLEMFLGMSQAAADSSGMTIYRGTDQATKLLVGGSSGFNAIFSGSSGGSTTNVSVGGSVLFWTSTSADNSSANYYVRSFEQGKGGINRTSIYPGTIGCVRCMKN